MHDSLWTGSIAELLVAYRFIEAGRRPAWPLTVCSYDLLVDGGDDIFRVQVKHARKIFWTQFSPGFVLESSVRRMFHVKQKSRTAAKNARHRGHWEKE